MSPPEELPIEPPKHCIVLIGFMGCGKSTVGRAVARRLHWEFLDTDRLITAEARMPIPEIFRKSGETGFRELEIKVLRSLVGRDRAVIATGGGIVTRQENVDLLREIGFVVWLNTAEEEIFERVSRNDRRPLLRTENPRETVALLFAEREPLYRAAADCVIETAGHNQRGVGELILLRARQYFDAPLAERPPHA